MSRVALIVTAAAVLVAAAVYSRTQPAARDATAPPGLTVTSEQKNPWTNLKLNADPEQFQFAVVTDRTGGHRAKVFSRAMRQINLLQPEFVVSVGDLIEGYSKDEEKVAAEWKEFDGYVNRLDMPFFYVPGNHDLTNPMQVETWGGRYGRKYYHFVYKNVLFLAVNSEDPVSVVSAEQQEYFRKALAENPQVRWTLVFLHKPLWTEKDQEKCGWAGMEKMLAGRKYTVFCGHEHRYVKFVRNGMNYYQLATTGGGSRLRGVRYGEFDQIVWATMKPTGPVLANVLLDGVLPEDLTLPEEDETAQPRKLEPTFAAAGRVALDGAPLANAMVRFYRSTPMGKAKFALLADALSEADGSFVPTTYKAFDGLPAGEYAVCVVRGGGRYDDGEAKLKNDLPEKYATPDATPLKLTVKADQKAEMSFELTK